jgi:hypothetical protein
MAAHKPGGGGASPGIPLRQSCADFNQSIAPGSLVLINWATNPLGDDLLDFTVPTLPAVKTAGFYLIIFDTECVGAQQPGKVVTYDYNMDYNDYDAEYTDCHALDGPMQGTFSHAISSKTLALWMPVGAVPAVRVKHNAAAALSFAYTFIVQKLWGVA